jgi:hypothetical protein
VTVPADGTAAPVAPAAAAFEELERAVRNLGEELAFFRRRALDAERRLRELSALGALGAAAAPQPAPAAPAPAAADPEEAGAPRGALRERVATLEAENGDLRARLAEAAERTRALADRVRFVRQQQQLAEDDA